MGEEVSSPINDRPQLGAKYELIAPIAEGAMGVVWRARQVALGRTVAVKLLRHAALPGEEVARRFRVEAEAAALLRHPHIVTVHEVGEHEGHYFLSMELVEGGTVADRLRLGRMPTEAAVRLLAQVARAIQHAHERGVLHRDIKPGNILLDAAGEPRVSDFGLARIEQANTDLTRTGVILGTPGYMSPEQAAGISDNITIASDVYSLGAVFYELLAGVPPFAGSAVAVLSSVLNDEPIPPSERVAGLDGDVETICLKCLAKEPSARYGSAAALADDLERWLRGEPIQARAPGTAERIWKWARRHKAKAALLATAATALVLVAVISLAFFFRLRHEVARATAAERATRYRLALQHSDAAAHFVASGDWLCALPHLVENLALVSGDRAAERLVRMRFAVIVRLAPKLIQMWLPQDSIGGIDFDDRAGRIVICSGSTAQVFDSTNGQQIGGEFEHAVRLRHAHFALGASRLLCETVNDTWHLWDLQSGSRIASGEGQFFPMESATGTVNRTRGDGRLFAVFQGNEVRTFSAAHGEPIGDVWRAPAKIAWAYASAEANRLLFATNDDRIHLRDAQSNGAVSLPIEAGQHPSLCALKSDEPFACIEARRADGSEHQFVLDLTTGRLVAEKDCEGTRLAQGWLGDSWVTLSRFDQGVILRDGQTGATLVTAVHGVQGVAAGYARDSSRFISASRDGRVGVWDRRGDLVGPMLRMSGLPQHVRLSAGGSLVLAASTLPAVHLWRLNEGGATFTGLRKVHGTGLEFREGKLLFFTGENVCSAWDLRTGVATSETTGREAPPNLRNIGQSACLEAKWAGEEGTSERDRVHVIDKASGRELFPPLQHENTVTGAAFSGDGHFILTVGRDAARLWNASTGGKVRVFREHPLPLTDGGFSPDGQLIWTRTSRHLYVWERKSGTLVLPPLVCSSGGAVAWSADGCWLAALDDRRGFRAWNLTPSSESLEEMRALARRLSSRGIAPDGRLEPLDATELREALHP